LREDIGDGLLRLVDIVSIADAENHVHPADILCGDTGDVVAGYFGIGDDNGLIVRCFELGGEDLDPLDGPRCAPAPTTSPTLNGLKMINRTPAALSTPVSG